MRYNDINKGAFGYDILQGVIRMTIGATIKQLRQEQDITQEQLAEALGITSRG